MSGEVEQSSIETENGLAEQERFDLYNNKNIVEDNQLIAQKNPATQTALWRLETAGHHSPHLTLQSFSK